MIRLSNLRIGTKLAIVSGIALLLLAAILGSEFINNGKLKSSANELHSRTDITLGIREIQDGTDGMQIAIGHIRLARTAQDLAEAKKDLDKHIGIASNTSDEVMSKLSEGGNR